NFLRAGLTVIGHRDGSFPAGYHSGFPSMLLKFVGIRSGQNLTRELSRRHGEQFGEQHSPSITGPATDLASRGEPGALEGKFEELIGGIDGRLAVAKTAQETLAEDGPSATSQHVGFDSHVRQATQGLGGSPRVVG